MTTPERHQLVSEIFLRVRALPAADQSRALDEACDGDAELRAEVLALLSYDVTSQGAEPAPRQEPPTNIAVPERIGPYRVISRIGRGGSGQVFLAEQTEPIRRRVAIKVVPQAAVNEELAARFDVERRALETVDHPSIARVLDAGRTADGLPYLVMDYIEGAPITDYCDQHNLNLQQRIELMLEVADAVQHVHQRGVIHRDLKPANILVIEVDGKPAPRVLDFGIAKPVRDALGAELKSTSGLPIGTPSYMAPEQTGIGTIDMRADVHGLGAVLYELVAGRPPIDGRGDLFTVLKHIREQIPPAPSKVRRQTLHGRPTPSAGSWMLTDLDCILGKALEKSPDRRYPTVAAFAEDLRRLLRFEPIEARRPTIRYRVTRFARRNRVLVAASAAVVLAVALGIVGLATGYVEADRQRKEALLQRDAQREINEFLTDDLLAAAGPDEMGPKVTALDLLNRASKRIEARFVDRPLIAASVHHSIGEAYAQLGAFDDAEKHLQTAYEQRMKWVGVAAPETIISEIARASLLVRRERAAEAERLLADVIKRARVILGPIDPRLYTALNDLGVAVLSQDRYEEAIPLFNEALAGRRKLLGDHNREVFMTTANLAYTYGELGRKTEAIDMMKQALAAAEGLDDIPQGLQLGIYNNIGATYQSINKREEAAPYLRRAAELARKNLGEDHPSTLTIRGNLAALEADLGRPDEAVTIYADLVEIWNTKLGPKAGTTLTARHGYCTSLRKAKRYDEAIDGFTTLLADVLASLGEKHALYPQTEISLAASLMEAGRNDEALARAEHAESIFTGMFGPEHDRTRGAAIIVKRIRDALAASSSSQSPG